MFYNKGRPQNKVLLSKEGKTDKVHSVCSVIFVERTYFIYSFCQILPVNEKKSPLSKELCNSEATSHKMSSKS